MNACAHTRCDDEKAVKTKTPAVDVYENDETFLLLAEIPGVKKEDLHIEWNQNQLSIEGKRAPFEETASAKKFVEFRYQRAFQIHQDIDEANIKAELKDGVLQLHIPKSPARKPKQIQIHSV